MCHSEHIHLLSCHVSEREQGRSTTIAFRKACYACVEQNLFCVPVAGVWVCAQRRSSSRGYNHATAFMDEVNTAVMQERTQPFSLSKPAKRLGVATVCRLCLLISCVSQLCYFTESSVERISRWSCSSMIQLEERAREIWDSVSKASGRGGSIYTRGKRKLAWWNRLTSLRRSSLDEHPVVNYEDVLGEPAVQTMSPLIDSSRAADRR